MASLQIADPAVRDYIKKHNLPRILQALLTGLCASCPDNPLHFLENKIKALKESKANEDITWHTCVDDSNHINRGTILHDLVGDTNNILLFSHLFEKAYSFYRRHLINMCFRSWKGFILKKRSDDTVLQLKMEMAERHYFTRCQRNTFSKLSAWVESCKRREIVASKKIQRVWDILLCKTVIAAWCSVTQDSKRTKEYFERLERDSLEMCTGEEEVNLGEGQDELSNLPSKLSVKIFQYLDLGDRMKCAEVCRTWKAIGHISILWSRINFSVENSWITDHTVEQILQKHRPFVSHLNMRGCISLRLPSFQCISECRNLQELNLSECSNVDDNVVRMIAEGCPSLLYLNLSYTPVNNVALRELSRSCLNLQYLSLAHCRRFTDKGVQYLTTGKGCHNLIHFDFSGCTQMSVESFKYIAAGCPYLCEIVCDDMPTLSDRCVMSLIEKCQCLTTISLLDTPHLSDVAFKAISEVAKLRAFATEGNDRITDVSWKLLCRSSPGLRRLNASDCPKMTDATLKSIAALKNLLYLNISHCNRLSDVGIRCLTDSVSAPKILELNLSHCSRINDISIMRLAQRFPRLCNLTLSYCDNLTDSGLEWLHSSPSLAYLDISGCNIEEQGLTALGTNTSLKKLILTDCPGITDTGIEKFCKQVRDLELIDVSHCVAVSDLAIKALSFYCRTLVTLRMAGCPKITDMSVQYLTGGGHYLRELDISGCELITDRSLRFLQRGRLQLTSITMLYCRGISKPAALRLQPHLKHWEHSNDDPPYWYGYDSLGQQPIRKAGKSDNNSEEEEQATVLSNATINV